MYAKFCELNDIFYDIYPVIGKHIEHIEHIIQVAWQLNKKTFSNKNSIWF